MVFYNATKNKVFGLPGEVVNYYNQNGKQPILYSLTYASARKRSKIVLQLGELYVFT